MNWVKIKKKNEFYLNGVKVSKVPPIVVTVINEEAPAKLPPPSFKRIIIKPTKDN